MPLFYLRRRRHDRRPHHRSSSSKMREASCDYQILAKAGLLDQRLTTEGIPLGKPLCEAAFLFLLATVAISAHSRAELVLDNITNKANTGFYTLWKAQSFVTSAGSWSLTRADLLLGNSATGLSVSIYDNSVTDQPGNLVATLSGPTSVNVGPPAAAVSFTSTGIALSGGTRYWLLQTANSGSLLYWGKATNNLTTGSWSVPLTNSTATSTNGTTWTTSTNLFAFSLYAEAGAPAPVPEPGTWAMAVLLLGGAASALVCKRNRRETT
jgi:hypothetical protein